MKQQISIGATLNEASTLSTGLHVVATPIGNLGDITIRALETLAAADLIACEDTRVTATLLKRYGIDTPRTPYHEHNADSAGEHLLDAIAQGKAVALVSDAGTPLISDPGQRLVAQARARGFAVFPVPGAASPIAALSASGLPSGRFTFFGFLPPKSAQRRKLFEDLAPSHGTAVYFESARRLVATLADAISVFGEDHTACVAREITKMHEDVRLASLADLHAYYADTPPRGEIVLLISPLAPTTIEDIDTVLRDLLASMSVSRASGEAAKLTGRPKRELYQRALQLTESKDA